MHMRKTMAICLFCLPTVLVAQPVFPLPDGCTAVEFRLAASSPVVARYIYGKGIAKPYVWPVKTPSGVVVTRSWPMIADAAGAKDHKHQKSAWFCHGDVSVSGISGKIRKGITGTDFWTEEAGHGRIVADSEAQAVGLLDGRPIMVSGGYLWQDASGRTLLKENRSLKWTPLAPNAWLLDWTSVLQATEGDVTFEDTKEGSMGIRVVDALTEKMGGQLINAKGQVGEKDVWGKQADWCAYAGKVDGKPVVIALLDHPANSRRACWHARGYGLMAANPFGRKQSGFPDRMDQTELVKISRGGILTLRYALLVMDGEVGEGGKLVAEQYRVWAKTGQ